MKRYGDTWIRTDNIAAFAVKFKEGQITTDDGLVLPGNTTKVEEVSIFVEGVGMITLSGVAAEEFVADYTK